MAATGDSDVLDRDILRATAAKVLRSDDLVADEKAVASAMLRENPAIGNPYAVRCSWCHQTRTLFRDENDGPFQLTAHGWFCTECNESAWSQEIKF